MFFLCIFMLCNWIALDHGLRVNDFAAAQNGPKVVRTDSWYTGGHAGTDTKPVSPQHILFEPVGQMAGSVSYLHVQIPLQFQDIRNHTFLYRSKLQEFQQALETIHQEKGGDPAANISVDFLLLQIVDVEVKAAELVHNRVSNLEAALPLFDLHPSVREKRGLLLSLGLGLIGTFMGLFTQKEINHLGAQLKTMKNRQDVLISITEEHHRDLKRLDRITRFNTGKLLDLYVNNPAVFCAQLQQQRRVLEDRIDHVQSVVNAAQYHRMGVGAVSREVLLGLYRQLSRQAGKLGYQLVPDQLSHFYQLDTSILRTPDGDAALLLHVPFVRKDFMLDMYRFHPVPVTFHDGTSLQVEPEDEILALGRGGLHKTMSLADLTKCKAQHSIFLCEGHNVLKTAMNDTCLGSLHVQDEGGVRSKCAWRLIDSEEVAYQIGPNTFMTFSPAPLTAPVTCTNGTRDYIRLRGHTEISLDSGCSCRLDKHLLTADFSLRVTASLDHYLWDYNPLMHLQDVKRHDLLKAYEDVLGTKETGVKLDRLVDQLRASKDLDPPLENASPYISLSAIAIIAVVILVLITIAWFLYRNREMLVRKWTGMQGMDAQAFITHVMQGAVGLVSGRRVAERPARAAPRVVLTRGLGSDSEEEEGVQLNVLGGGH